MEPNQDASPDRAQATRALARACSDDQAENKELTDLVYEDLRRLASALLRKERANHTLQPTALVHEAWMRLVDQTAFGNPDDAAAARRQFLAYGVQAMRRILIDHARGHNSEKRGGGRKRAPISDSIAFDIQDPSGLLDLDAALTELAARKPRVGKVAELRIYAGLSTAEAAESLQISTTTAKGDWALAQAILTKRIRG